MGDFEGICDFIIPKSKDYVHAFPWTFLDCVYKTNAAFLL